RIEVQNGAGFVGEVGITWKNPVLVTPRFDGIRIEYPPHRTATDRCAQHGVGPGGDIGQGLAAQWLLGFCDQFTGDRLDQCVVQRGKTPPCGPVPACRPRQSPPWPNGVANDAPNAEGVAPAVPPRCWTPAVVETRAGPGQPVAAPGTTQSFDRQALPPAPRMVLGTQGGSSVRGHTWEVSSSKNDYNSHQPASHFSSKASRK